MVSAPQHPLLFVLQQALPPQLVRAVAATITTKTNIIFFIIHPCHVVYYKYTTRR